MLTATKGWVSIVESPREERRSSGGIYLGTSDKTYTRHGRVHSGPNEWKDKEVIFNIFSAHTVETDGIKLVVVKEEEVLLVGDK